MSERPVGLSFLRKASARLDAGLTRYRQDIHDEQIRGCLIQRFEFTYEISQKTLKRFLKASSASPQEPGLGRAISRISPTAHASDITCRPDRQGGARCSDGTRYRRDGIGVVRSDHGTVWRKGRDGLSATTVACAVARMRPEPCAAIGIRSGCWYADWFVCG